MTLGISQLPAAAPRSPPPIWIACSYCDTRCAFARGAELDGMRALRSAGWTSHDLAVACPACAPTYPSKQALIASKTDARPR